jgi:hypothetical protein
MKETVLTRQVERWWPDLDEQLTAIEQDAPPTAPARRNTHEMLEEVLTLLRAMSREHPVSLAEGGMPSDRSMSVSAGHIQRRPGTVQLLTKRARHLARQAFEDIRAVMGADIANMCQMYYDSERRTVILAVPDGTLIPDELTSALRGRAKARQMRLEVFPHTQQQTRKGRRPYSPLR